MKLTMRKIQKIEEKNLPLKELVSHPAFSHVVNETNNITGAVCSVYFWCSEFPTKFVFVGIGKIKDLPPGIKIVTNPYSHLWKREKMLEYNLHIKGTL